PPVEQMASPGGEMFWVHGKIGLVGTHAEAQRRRDQETERNFCASAPLREPSYGKKANSFELITLRATSGSSTPSVAESSSAVGSRFSRSRKIPPTSPARSAMKADCSTTNGLFIRLSACSGVVETG